MKNLVQYQLNEKERIAYINGDKDSANLFSLLADGNDTKEIDGIDDALDLLGVSGKRGDSLYAAIEYISKKLEAAEELNRRLSTVARLPKEARTAILEFRESFE